MQLRDYQIDIATKANKLLHNYKIAYLAMQVRTGKTFTALHTATLYNAKHVLFVTKKKAITSIQADYDSMQPAFKIIIINYESITKPNIDGVDLVICDEAHCMGQYPIASQRTNDLKNICKGLPIIYLSGTPTPESYSQIFHQLYISYYTPFSNYTNFYRWAKDFINIKTKYVFNRQLNDYSEANQDKIKQCISHLFLTYTQQEAGFIQNVKEEILQVQMKESTYVLAKKLINSRVVIGKNGDEVLADTEVKLMQKLHQIYSGTVKCEDGKAICFDNTKALFIKEHFAGKKIAIFYKFIAEFTVLMQTFGDSITTSTEDFAASNDKVFCSQIQSGREGINLSTADCLIMYNIDFSSVSYQQAKARIQAKDRIKECLLYWIFSNAGIEQKIYQRVINKQNFTLSYFKKIAHAFT